MSFLCGAGLKQSAEFGHKSGVAGTAGLEDLGPLGFGEIHGVVKDGLCPLPVFVRCCHKFLVEEHGLSAVSAESTDKVPQPLK